MHACELYKSKDPKGRSFGLLHCWNILQHEQKWKDRCVQKKQKSSGTGSPSSSPGTNESHQEDDGEGHTSEPVVRPGGRKAEKERQRQGKILSLLEIIFIWKRWKTCGLRRKRQKP